MVGEASTVGWLQRRVPRMIGTMLFEPIVSAMLNVVVTESTIGPRAYATEIKAQWVKVERKNGRRSVVLDLVSKHAVSVTERWSGAAPLPCGSAWKKKTGNLNE